MNWILLSFAVITPMNSSITLAFRRREDALKSLMVFRSTLSQLFSAHAIWDWSKPSKEPSGREICDIDWVAHTDLVLHQILQICSETTRMLTLPFTSRARHRICAAGKKESAEVMGLMFNLDRSIKLRIARLSDLCEVLKRQGLPPNEATRIRQWERMVVEALGTYRSDSDWLFCVTYCRMVSAD
jgi:hypothetical protein